MTNHMTNQHKKQVALVLSSGGARGYAHIGAIRALEEQGYEITSVAGASMGALVGGVYCAGKLKELTEWFCSLTKRDMFSLMDFSLSTNHVMKGKKVMSNLETMLGNIQIEELTTDFRAIAADLATQREVVFSKGSLLRSIRSSISMPSVLKPIKIASHVLIDGGIVNPLPLNRVPRHEGDILVSVNVSAPASEQIEEAREAERRRIKKENGLLSLQRMMQALTPDQAASNYMTIISSAIALQIQRNTVITQKLYQPDIAVNIPMNRFGVFDFDRAEDVIEAGYEAMKERLLNVRF